MANVNLRRRRTLCYRVAEPRRTIPVIAALPKPDTRESDKIECKAPTAFNPPKVDPAVPAPTRPRAPPTTTTRSHPPPPSREPPPQALQTIRPTKPLPHTGNRQRIERMEAGSEVTEASAGPEKRDIIAAGLEKAGNQAAATFDPSKLEVAGEEDEIQGATRAPTGPRGACIGCGGGGHSIEECFGGGRERGRNQGMYKKGRTRE